MIKHVAKALIVFYLFNLLPQRAWAQSTYDQQMVYELNQKGVAEYNDGDYYDAILTFKDGLSRFPDDTIIKSNLVAAYTALGSDLVTREEYDEAITHFESAIDLDDEDQDIKQTLAFSYFKVAERFHNLGELDDTIEYMRKGLEYNPDHLTMRQHLSVGLYNKAMSLYSDHEYKSAKIFLLESLSYDKSSSYSHELLGDIAYYSQELDEAKTYWLDALKMENSDRVQKKLQKLSAEMGVDDELRDYPSENFVLKYEKSKELYGGYKLREILRKAYRKVGLDFNYFPKRKIVVLVYEPDNLKAVLSHEFPDWARAGYDGKIRLPQENRGVPNNTLTGMVWHEYSHALVHELSGGNCPRWLNEGLSEWVEEKVVPHDLSPIKKMVANGYKFSVETDLLQNVNEMNNNNAHVFYLASYTLVKYLVKRYRMFKVKEILKNMSNGMDFEAAMKKSIFLSYKELNKKWNQSLRTL